MLRVYRKHTKEGHTMNLSTMATAAVGMAVGAAVMGMATQDRRQMRKTVHKLAKGAEKTLVDLDKAVQQMHW